MHRKEGRWLAASSHFFHKLFSVKHLRRYKVGATGFESAGNFDVTADWECPCDFCLGWRAANALQNNGINCLDVAQLDADLQRVISAWNGLAEVIRRVVLTLVGTS